VVGAEGSGETPTEETGLPTLPPEEPGTGSGEADPTVHTGLLYPGEGMERMVPPNSASQTAPPLPGNPQAAGIPGVTYSPTMENYDPRLLEQWARNRTAMLYPYLG
jgi:hypothetical protein